MSDIKWMEIAIEQAQEAEKLGEVPVGAVLVID
ncbi:MAG TPA: tRNA adenosine(34) deaminase TadA, partial [Gammaproteobacteria bacterium]|nr:tRNA adenosine(34) deaminase TadA [Gammaproteobacteria bacterium]